MEPEGELSGPRPPPPSLPVTPRVAGPLEARVPRHRHTWVYLLGGLALFFLIVQVASGILLLLYYRPTSEAAFDSVEFIMTRVAFGWLVRSIHAWAGSAMVLAVSVHMAGAFFMGAYARPRERTWWTGAALLGLTLGFGFSGCLLPWNTRAFFATQVGTDLLGKVPLAGGWLLRFLRGGNDVSGATLTRFFGLHVSVLPLLTCLLLATHLVQVHRAGLHLPRSLEEEARRRPALPFIPDFALREAAVWVAALGALAALATLRPQELGARADPLASAPSGIRPAWYFLFLFQALKLIPARVAGVEGELMGLWAIAAAAFLWFLAPVLDRAAPRGGPSRIATSLGLAGAAFFLVMTALALRGGASP